MTPLRKRMLEDLQIRNAVDLSPGNGDGTFGVHIQYFRFMAKRGAEGEVDGVPVGVVGPATAIRPTASDCGLDQPSHCCPFRTTPPSPNAVLGRRRHRASGKDAGPIRVSDLRTASD